MLEQLQIVISLKPPVLTVIIIIILAYREVLPRNAASLLSLHPGLAPHSSYKEG